MFTNRSREGLTARLAEVEAEIFTHPLSSERVTRAHALIEAMGDAETAVVDARLAEQGLPSLGELGRLQLRHTASWSRLHREKRKAQRLLDKLDR